MVDFRLWFVVVVIMLEASEFREVVEGEEETGKGFKLTLATSE